MFWGIHRRRWIARPEKAAANELLRERIEQLLKTLTYREREIIRLRYGLGDGYTYTLEEVGRIFKVTRERVRQIEAKAVKKLQHPVAASSSPDSSSEQQAEAGHKPLVPQPAAFFIGIANCKLKIANCKLNDGQIS